MRRKAGRGFLYGLLALAYLLHNDLWLWNDGRIVLGLPVGLLYHVVFCVAVAALMGLLAWRAWPSEEGELAAEDEGER